MFFVIVFGGGGIATESTAEHNWTEQIAAFKPMVVNAETSSEIVFETEAKGTSFATGFIVDAERGIIVTNTPDVLTEEVADYGVALLLAAARRIVAGDRYVRERRWPKEGAMAYGQRVHGKRLGILGLGRIGMAIARRCEAFGMEIGYHNRNRRDDLAYPYFEDAVSLGDWADYFIVITPGGEGTRHLVDASVMSAIGPEGILVNVGRGPTVDDEALASALREGRLGLAALDVFADEPKVPENFLDLELKKKKRQKKKPRVRKICAPNTENKHVFEQLGTRSIRFSSKKKIISEMLLNKNSIMNAVSRFDFKTFSF